MKAIRGGYRIAFSFVPTHDRLPPWRAMMRGGRRRSSFFPIMNTTILNEGLSLAMEWGEQWLCPIQERLATAHPELSREELDRYDELCRAAMHHAHALVAKCWRSADTRDEQLVFARFAELLGKTYPWISPENVSRAWSQGMYYAWKDGGLPL